LLHQVRGESGESQNHSTRTHCRFRPAHKNTT